MGRRREVVNDVHQITHDALRIASKEFPSVLFDHRCLLHYMSNICWHHIV